MKRRHNAIAKSILSQPKKSLQADMGQHFLFFVNFIHFQETFYYQIQSLVKLTLFKMTDFKLFKTETVRR